MAVYESEFGGSLKQLELVSFLNDIDLFVFMDDGMLYALNSLIFCIHLIPR